MKVQIGAREKTSALINKTKVEDLHTAKLIVPKQLVFLRSIFCNTFGPRW